MPRDPFLALLIVCSGCAVFLPARKDPVKDAKEKESEVCPAGSAPQYPQGLFDSRSVVQVEDFYSTVRTGRSGNEARLQGVRLRLRPFAGTTTTSLEALLYCHQARRILGRSSEVELKNDPYYLPRSWVNISVDSEGGNFLVSIRGSDIKDANEIFSRAKAFAASGNHTSDGPL